MSTRSSTSSTDSESTNWWMFIAAILGFLALLVGIALIVIFREAIGSVANSIMSTGIDWNGFRIPFVPWNLSTPLIILAVGLLTLIVLDDMFVRKLTRRSNLTNLWAYKLWIVIAAIGCVILYWQIGIHMAYFQQNNVINAQRDRIFQLEQLLHPTTITPSNSPTN